ncbi:nitrite reductase small subunit NirD [Solitalea canadensis]|uniref:NAD(P)H-dependent nitrite reductase, small subunit n=1 Tax=Solitalea canadensis (strain ATCC 29591 / DSM 3403 / JCM 21819 / LMG 8368 / NBRC 15130 / NCIMB 12057 / USAM 9D) TaxID=929556 RepID=H8KW24_SOLCM|nr:nitrite reductase small subunit NirD [Solitalea canadensis]AFD07045.1 NAD(P)H-dependent nitrite reductase, small subunit [Solitalea canadensis DSM 3403]
MIEDVLTAWVLACNASDIPENGGACVKVEDEQIAIFNFKRRNEWYATQNLCPHKQQMVLSRGMIGSTGENCEPKVACPFHKNTFSLETGQCLTNDEYQIKVYPVKVENGKVYISLE